MLNINGTYYSSKCGPMIILQELNNGKYLVKFLNTGTEKIARDTAIKSGAVRDQFALLNCGVACTGNAKTKGKNAPYYNVWNSMIHRCYAEQDGKYRIYKNVTVCDRWLIFENFLADCRNIDGFDEEMFLSGNLVLDKDIKQRHQTNKVYSPETCTWVSKRENALYQDAQMRPFEAISPQGEVFHSENIAAFAREHGLIRKHVSGVLHNRARTTGGWKFRFL